MNAAQQSNLIELTRRTEDRFAEQCRGRAAAAADGDDAAVTEISAEIGATRQTLDELRARAAGLIQGDGAELRGDPGTKTRDQSRAPL